MKIRLASALAALLLLAGCASGTPAAEPTKPPWSSGQPPRGTTPSTVLYDNVPDPEPISYTIRCSVDGGSRKTFDTYQDVWASQETFTRCESGTKKGTVQTDAQKAALEVYGESATESTLGILHALCADLHFSHYGSLDTFSERQIPEIRASLTLCPDQPAAEALHAKIAASELALEQFANGTRFRGGTHKIGVDIQPGSYYSEGEFDGCYWEILDSAGNIIDNNFILSGFRVEVYIPDYAYSFSSERCGVWAPLE